MVTFSKQMQQHANYVAYLNQLLCSFDDAIRQMKGNNVCENLEKRRREIRIFRDRMETPFSEEGEEDAENV